MYFALNSVFYVWTKLSSMYLNSLICWSGSSEPYVTWTNVIGAHLHALTLIFREVTNAVFKGKLSVQSSCSWLCPSLQTQHLSHASFAGPWPCPGMCSVSQQLCSNSRKWRSHPLGTNGQPSDWVANARWDSGSRPLELPSPHEFIPADDSCYRPLHGIHGDKCYWQSAVGTATAAWMDVNFRWSQSIISFFFFKSIIILSSQFNKLCSTKLNKEPPNNVTNKETRPQLMICCFYRASRWSNGCNNLWPGSRAFVHFYPELVGL